MNVKRTIAIILILSIIVVAVFALSGCNITNDGSEDELKGIYGVTTMYYKSFEGKKYNVSGQYEYFLLILNGDEGRTGKVIMKRDGDAEFSYDITYTPKFNSDGKNDMEHYRQRFPSAGIRGRNGRGALFRSVPKGVPFLSDARNVHVQPYAFTNGRR